MSQNKIPEKITMFGHEFKIRITMVDERQGCVDFNSCIIYLHEDLPTSLKWEVLQHEIFEVIKYHLELSLEHRDLQALSSAFYGIRKDNKI
jgi:hypothetical protein